MGIDDAVQAVEWINPKIVVPIHYNTFPFIVQDAEEFVIKLSEKDNQMRLGVFAPRLYRAPLDKFPLKICGFRRRL
ncbi:hypothetical protein J6TS1_48650 [Siminovitchia terrae]|uniref:Metal-dependent hydrolase n=1 Tax=Siminovitchia terrae TaxID=1914933 RepID=A0ABQ4L418_SIMTE|nr:hypothetical protein J22TS1_16980 [Siminovitchia terrae]GIN98995.1 hypothetical protein J6TS1_48650 [Siminovitchia terrae]